MDYHFDQIYTGNCVTIESNVFHQFKFHLQRLSCMNILCSLRKRGGLEIDFEIGIPILCFRRRPQKKLVSAHCTVMSMFWPWQMKITKDVYFQSCHLMFRGLILYFVDFFIIPSKSIKTHTKQLIVWCFVSLLKLLTHIKTSPLPGIGARFPDCDLFFLLNQKNIRVS